MKCFLSFYVFFLFGIVIINAQNSTSTLAENRNSYVTFSLLPITDPFAPRLRVGYTQHLALHWKIGLDLGFGDESTSLLPKTDNYGVEYFLWEVRPEIYYIFNPNTKTLKYVSIEMFYIDQEHVFENGDYSPEDGGSDYRFDRADFERQKYGMHFKFGLFLNLGKHIGFNFYGGVGFRFVNKQYSNFVNREEADIFREWFTTPYTDEGANFLPMPSLGIKFYYKI
ncbi:MAG: hypothetical protein WBM83_04930 [Flavobacteriaceae bacterium]